MSLTVYKDLDALKEKKGDVREITLPEQSEEDATAERTRLALQALLESKIKKAKPSTVTISSENEPTYIRYTPNPSAPGYAFFLASILYFLLFLTDTVRLRSSVS